MLPKLPKGLRHLKKLSNLPSSNLPSSRRRGCGARGLVVLLVVFGISVGIAIQVGAQGEDLSDLRRQRQALEEELAVAAADIDVAEATADELVDALNKVQAAVDSQSAEVDAAEQAVAEAEARIADAEEQIAALEAERDRTKDLVRESALHSYMSFQSPQGAVGVLGEDLWDDTRDETLVAFATGSHADDLDRLRSIAAELEEYRQLAEESHEIAETRQAELEVQLGELTVALDREGLLTAEAEARVETRLYEAQALKDLDANLSARIQNEERKIAEAIARARAEEADRRRAESAGLNDERAQSARSTLPRDSDITLVNVRGFVVNEEIAEDTRGLLIAMENEGYVLGGGGYRSHQSQISLRRAHCGTSEYAIWQMRASQCRPPTARPGTSDHETGNAIDFSYQGRIIWSRNTDVFRTLARVAPEFGFENLPSEPWHWSNT